MGILVSAAEAGLLVGRHERMVRWHITTRRDLPGRKSAQGQWLVDVDDLTRVPGWVVDRERLAKLELRQTRSHGGLVARMEALETRIRQQEAHIRALQERLRQLNNEDNEDGDPPPGDPAPAPTPTPPASPSGYRGPSTVTLADRGPGVPLAFRTRADAARWLERHGVMSAKTPPSWRGWHNVTLTPTAVLTFALHLRQEATAQRDWRVDWHLRPCDDAACVCHDLLADAPQ